MDKVKAVIATIVIGYIATVVGGELMNWPQFGPIAAVATMGVYILNKIENIK